MPSAYEGTDIIMSEANNKVPGHPLEIFDFVSGSGSYIMLAKQVYHTALPYIISHKRYIIEKPGFCGIINLHKRIWRTVCIS